MHTLFISDLHLSEQTPELNRTFRHFMTHDAPHADALYVLGDLFDFWIGDDDPSPFATEIKSLLRQLTQSGTRCYFIHGNRDFLLGQRFAKETGVELLAEETVVNLYGESILLLHGDTLCTQDEQYLAFRAKVHIPWLQKAFKCLPFALRKKITNRIQGKTKTNKSMKTLNIMDVTQSEVEAIMEKYHVNIMIHGHTHRPDIHTFTMRDQQKTRVVIGDWNTKYYVVKFDSLRRLSQNSNDVVVIN